MYKPPKSGRKDHNKVIGSVVQDKKGEVNEDKATVQFYKAAQQVMTNDERPDRVLARCMTSREWDRHCRSANGLLQVEDKDSVVDHDSILLSHGQLQGKIICTVNAFNLKNPRKENYFDYRWKNRFGQRLIFTSQWPPYTD
uniref:Uncharacterized protein n=1 Tax=Branchiostoma floridae TaxID=7739 RepID=C3ZZT1_BRAFL|eukprot:XP_002585942.1 hypothetical protein BRAFLDRAFT_109115 [Branchiostoma floridae]